MYPSVPSFNTNTIVIQTLLPMGGGELGAADGRGPSCEKKALSYVINGTVPGSALPFRSYI